GEDGAPFRGSLGLPETRGGRLAPWPTSSPFCQVMAHLVRRLRSKFRRRRGDGRAGERPGAALVFLRRHSSTCKTETRAPATTGEHRPGRPLPQGRSTREIGRAHV